MSKYNINSNPSLVNLMIENERKATEKYYAEHPDSLIPFFEQKLRELGFEFEVSSQTISFMPKYKKTILPIAISFYQQSVVENDKNHFLRFFHFKGCEGVIPMMLNDFYYSQISNTTRALIVENLRIIQSRNYIQDYLKILNRTELAEIRNGIIELLGNLKITDAIVPLISALDEGGNITTNAICALGKFKCQKLRPYFEQFSEHNNSYYKKEAIKALQKLG